MKDIIVRFVVLFAFLGAAGRVPADEASEAKAKALYKEGVAHHQKGEYAQAIKNFKEADDLVQSPALAYNIAQSYRLLGDCRQALQWYRTYLDRDPLAPNKDKVNEYIGKMVKCLPKHEEPAPPPPPPPKPEPEVTPPPPPPAPPPPAPEPTPTPTPPPPVAVTPPPPAPVVAPAAPPPRPEGSEEHPGRGKKITGAILAAAGVVAIGTGVLFALQAHNEADKVSLLSQSGGAWTSGYADIESSGKRDQTISDITLAVGGVAIVGGVVLYVMGAHESAAPPPITVGALPGGGDIVVSWRY